MAKRPKVEPDDGSEAPFGGKGKMGGGRKKHRKSKRKGGRY